MKYLNKILPLFLLSLSPFIHAQDTEAADSANGIFDKVEVEASYPGGSQAWKKYLEKNLKGEVPTDNGAPEGKYPVQVRFIVKKDGSISDVKAITKMGYGTEQEVVRLIKASGKWNPGSQSGGRFVSSYHVQPVTFMVDDDALDIKSETDYVLYANKDNALSINYYKVKPENLKAVISKGTITPIGDGEFIVRVPKAGERVTITVYNSKKDDKELGAVIFDVKAKE
jgi:GldM C-terminal domain